MLLTDDSEFTEGDTRATKSLFDSSLPILTNIKEFLITHVSTEVKLHIGSFGKNIFIIIQILNSLQILNYGSVFHQTQHPIGSKSPHKLPLALNSAYSTFYLGCCTVCLNFRNSSCSRQTKHRSLPSLLNLLPKPAAFLNSCCWMIPLHIVILIHPGPQTAPLPHLHSEFLRRKTALFFLFSLNTKLII